MTRKVQWYINAASNSDQPPWEWSGGFIPVGEYPADWCDLAGDGTRLPYTPEVMANRNKRGIPMHMAYKTDGLDRDSGVWTAFYRWDAKKQKFICTRYRDYIRRKAKEVCNAS